MFRQVEVILDIQGRPVFVLSEGLPEGNSSVEIVGDVLTFYVEGQKVGQVEGLPAEVLVLTAQKKEVGLIVWEDEKQPCPTGLTHVAKVASDDIVGDVA